MRIAYFVNQYPKVSHTFIRREILALEAQGFEVQRIALRGWQELPPDPTDVAERSKTRYVLKAGLAGLIGPVLLAAAGSPLRLLRALRLAWRLSRQSDRRPAMHLVRVAEACLLARWLREAHSEHVHAHFGTNSAEVVMYCRVLGGPTYSFTAHGPEEFESPMGIDLKVGGSAFVAAISSYGRSQIYLRCQPADWPKVQVVRCGVDRGFHDAAVSPAAQRRLVCVGRLCAAKGQVLLLEAMARLRARGVCFELVLVGDGELRSEVEAAIARHALADSVRITGWTGSDRVREEILGSRALVLPSFAEGLPVVIMEAMALRRPVLSTFVAGIPELVVPRETGWLFPAGSIADLEAAIEDCLARSAEEIGRMGEAGHVRVLGLHSIDREAGKLAALFRRGAAAQ